ncbi:MAG: hypothetical protein PHP64_03350 [Actinomycetota bacterium]|nr:hypothetical protein [Actinomycetota bacterium]
MRECQKCGVPRALTNDYTWGSNGTISLRKGSSHRMVMLDNDALNHIFRSIEETIGLPLETITLEAKRKSGKDYIDKILTGVKGTIVRNLASKKVYEQLSNQLRMLGYGRAEVLAYHRREFLEGAVENVYNGAALTGDVAGAFESVEKKSGDCHYSTDDNNVLHLRINITDEVRSEYRNRFLYEPGESLPGRNIFELCPVCHAPVELGRQYTFDPDSGTIKENKTGHRIILIGIMTLNNLFGELTSELGDEIPRIIMSIERDRVKDVIGAKPKELDTSEAGYLRYAKTLELKGMGNGTLAKVDGERVKVRIENPYYEPLLAGFISGFYEATTGKKSIASWTPVKDGFTEITVEAAS